MIRTGAMYTNNNQYSDMDIDYAQGNTTTIITQIHDTRTSKKLEELQRRGRGRMTSRIKFPRLQVIHGRGTKMLRPVDQTYRERGVSGMSTYRARNRDCVRWLGER